MSIKVNIDPTPLSIDKWYKGVANIDGIEYKFNYNVSKTNNKVESLVWLHNDFYTNIEDNVEPNNQEKEIEKLSKIEKRIIENINHNDVW